MASRKNLKKAVDCLKRIFFYGIHDCVQDTHQTGKAHHKHCETNHQLSHVPEMHKIVSS